LSVTDMLVDLSVLLARLLGAKVELSVTHGKDIGCIKVDQVHFEQVIINLAVNARDAMPNGGKLTINTTNQRIDKQKFMRGEMIPEGHYVAIAIEDTGCGIPEGILGRIFDPFFSTKEKGNGTGLGLSTVYGIVKQTGGFIDIESTVGKGTTFTLYFPICECDMTPKPKPTYQETQIQIDTTGNGKILLVEDEEAVRMFGARALRDKGYTVVEASNGESALDFIKNNKRPEMAEPRMNTIDEICISKTVQRIIPIKVAQNTEILKGLFFIFFSILYPAEKMRYTTQICIPLNAAATILNSINCS